LTLGCQKNSKLFPAKQCAFKKNNLQGVLKKIKKERISSKKTEVSLKVDQKNDRGNKNLLHNRIIFTRK